MRQINNFTAICVFLLFLSCSLKNTGQSEENAKTNKKSDKEITSRQIEKSDKIVWLSYDEAVELSRKEPKKIFVDVYTNWCGWCKRMDATTLQDPAIVGYMNEKFYAVKLNAESNKKVNYKGTEMTEQQLASRIFKASGYPTTVYLTPDEDILQPIPGYLDVDMLNKILHFYGDEHFKTTSWERFSKSFNSNE